MGDNMADTATNQDPTINYLGKVQRAIEYNDPAEAMYRDNQQQRKAAEAAAVEYERRELVDEDGGKYVIEDREDGPYVIARQKGDDPIKSYGDEGLRLDEVPESAVDRDVLDTVGQIAEGTARGIGLGVTQFVGNVVRSAVDNPIGDFAIGAENVERFEQFSKEFLDNAEKAAGHTAFGDKEDFGTAGQIAVGVGEVAGQYIAPAAGAYKLFRAAGAGALLSSILADGVVGFFGVAPEQSNLANLIPEDSKAFKALRDLLATDPEDGEFENRARNAAEAMGVLGLSEAAMRGVVGAVKAGKAAVKSIELPESVGRAIDKTLPKALAAGAGAGAFAGSAEAGQGGPTAEEMQKALDDALMNGGPQDRDAEGMDLGSPGAEVLKDLRSLEDTLHPGKNRYYQTLAMIESSDNPKAQNKSSTAKGRYQFIDSTAKSFGLDKYKFGTKEYEIAEEAAVRKFTEQNRAGLQKGLNREPSPGELYLAHQQGLSGALKLLKNPLKPAHEIVGMDAVRNNLPEDQRDQAANIKAWQFARIWTGKFKEHHDGTKEASLGMGGFQRLADEMNSKDFQLASARSELVTKAGKLIAKQGDEIVQPDVVQRARAALEMKGSAEGLDFNLDKMETSEQLDNLIDTISSVYKEPINKSKRGVQTFSETQAKADLSRTMGFDVETVISRRPGEIWPAEKIKAARDIFVSELQKTEDLARAIKSGENTSENLIQFRRQLAVVSAVQSQIKGVQTETARALSQYRMTAKSPMEAQVNLAEMIQKSGGADMNEALVDAYLNVIENGGPDAAATFARNADQVNGMDMLYEAWINSLLGSPSTHAVNMLGNTLTIKQSVIERYAAASYGSIERATKSAFGKQGGGITFNEANAYAQGQAMAMNDAMNAFLKALKTGEGSDIFGKLDTHKEAITAANVNELPLAKTITSKFMQGDELVKSNSQLAHMIDFMGEYYFRLPGRMLMAEDEFFKTMNYRAQLHALAAREAGEQGLDQAAHAQRLEQILADPQLNAPELHQQALEFAREQTFTTPPGEVAQKLSNFLNNAKIGDFPAGRVVVPFFNVINNITKYVGGRVPGFGLINPNSKTYKDFFSKDPAKRQLVMGKWATGGSLLGFGAWASMNGICTGRISDNSKMVKQIEEGQGKKRYACHLPGTDKMMNYNRLEPAGMLMAIAADTATALAYVNNDEERENLVLAATAAFVPYMQDKSFFDGISRFFEAFNPQYGDDNARSQALGRYFTDLMASAPGAVMGPLAPNTPLARNINKNVLGDNAKRISEANKWTIEKDEYGDEILVADSESYQMWQRTVNKIFSGTPGLSKNLPADVNIWGEEIRYEGGLGPDIVTPIYTNTPKFDIKDLKGHNFPKQIEAGRFRDMRVGYDITIDQHREFVKVVGIDGELERLNMPLSKPRSDISARVNGKVVGLPIELNPSDRIDLIKIMNEISPVNDADPERQRMNLKQTLDWMISQPEYAKLPDDSDATGSKGDLIRSVYNKYKGAAVELFFQQHPKGQAYFRKSLQAKMKAQNTGVQ